MRLSQRQYVYIALILLLAVYNGVRFYRARHATPASVDSSTPAAQSPPGTSPLWAIYDRAATARTANDDQFHPALETLSQALESGNAATLPPQTPTTELADLRGCRTWLLFFRQEFLHPAINKPGWHQQTEQHVVACMTHHRDDA